MFLQPEFLYDDADEDPSVPPEPIIVIEEPPLVTKKSKRGTPKSAAKGKGKGKK